MASNAAMINVEKFLADVPFALKFHGISDDELRDADITPEEFVYLLTISTAGAIYYRTLRKADVTDDPFEVDSYRYIMCSQPVTRRAWPIIKKLTGDHVFRVKMDKTIALIEETERKRIKKSAEEDKKSHAAASEPEASRSNPPAAKILG